MVILIIILITGCSGNYGRIKNQSRSDSKITQQELIDNWSDYNIWFRTAVIVFDPKNDDKTILVGSHWGTVKDQETWTQIVKANTSAGNVTPMWASYEMTPVREIWGPDNQLYGYVMHQIKDLVSVIVIDENTMRLHYHRARFGGP